MTKIHIKLFGRCPDCNKLMFIQPFGYLSSGELVLCQCNNCFLKALERRFKK